MPKSVLLAAGLPALMATLPVWANNAPQISNVSASQRGDGSRLVDIYYNLADADGDACTVWVSVSSDGGTSWRVPTRTFSGHVGQGVAPGAGKHIIWDAGADVPGAAGTFRARVWADDGNSPDPMVPVPAGWFPYQNTSNLGQWVYVDDFMIDKYEVTNVFYCQFLNNADPAGDHWYSGQEIYRLGSPGSYYYTVYEGRENYPVRFVSADDADAFAAWRSSVTGATYRLPTPYEWEKAAAWDPIEEHYYAYGYHEDTISCSWCNHAECNDGPMPVGSYDGTGGREDARSYYGCYDMSGNVWEWTTETNGVYRVTRGGAWFSPSPHCWCKYRNDGYNDGNTHYSRKYHVGFRLVLELD